MSVKVSLKRPKFLELMAIGDAFGMKYEFIHREDEPDVTKDDLFYGSHPKYTDYRAAHYTDDTQMALANAELLKNIPRDHEYELEETDFVNVWMSAFQRDPRDGYSRYMKKVLSESKTIQDFMGAVDPVRGTTSGAAMRAAPFGLIPDLNEALRLSEMQASVTHCTSAGITSALAVTAAVHYYHNGGTKEGFDDFIMEHVGDIRLESSGFEENPQNALRIVIHAFDALAQSETLSDVLVNCINQSKFADTDTICAIAMAIASRSEEFKDDLPQVLYDTLEDGSYGQEFLQMFDENLLQYFRPAHVQKTESAVDHKIGHSVPLVQPS